MESHGMKILSDVAYLRETVRISEDARAAGNHPFGALLVDPEGAVILRSGNTFKRDKGIGHAELNVARAAAADYDATFLARCLLVTSVKP